MKKYFKLISLEIEDETNFSVSKLSGSPVFPLGFLKEHKLDEDLFVCQINLSELDIDLLPKEGFLYFFLNVDMYPYVPKVFYSNDIEPIEVYDKINEGFEYFTTIKGYKIDWGKENTGMGICLKDNHFDLDEDTIILLQFDSLEIPTNSLNLGNPDGWYLFTIKEEELKKLDFSNVKFIVEGS